MSRETQSVEDMVAQVDTGGRNAAGWQGKMIIGIAFTWALFQLYYGSNLPFLKNDKRRQIQVMNETRSTSMQNLQNMQIRKEQRELDKHAVSYMELPENNDLY